MLNPRLKAICQQCQKRGGSCGCFGSCVAERELILVRDQLRSNLSSVEQKLRWLTPSTVKADWARPAPPPGNYSLAVHHTGDGWWPHWYDPDAQVDCIDIEGTAAWPFNEDYAFAEDWEALGFEVV